MFSAGGLPASCSDPVTEWYIFLDRRQGDPGLPREDTWLKAAPRSRSLCPRAHRKCSFPVYSWDDARSQESSVPEHLVSEVLARPKVLRLRRWTHLFSYTVKTFSWGQDEKSTFLPSPNRQVRRVHAGFLDPCPQITFCHTPESLDHSKGPGPACTATV